MKIDNTIYLKHSPKVLSIITFTLLPIIGFIVGHFYNPKTVVQVVEVKVKETPITAPSPKEVMETPSSLFNKIFSKDIKRSDSEICGYTEEIYEQMAKSIGLDKDNFLSRRSSGVWSFDCETYAYGMYLTGHNFFIKDQIGGIWIYKPSGKISKQLSRQDDEVERWLTKDILVTARFVMNVKSGAVTVENPDYIKNALWTKFRYSSSEFPQASFPWSFMYPDIWKIDVENTVIKDGKILILTFITDASVHVKFYIEDPQIDLSSYSTTYYYNNLEEYEYKLYSLVQKRDVYIYNGDGMNYPKAIVVGGPGDKGPNLGEYSYIEDILKTIRRKVD